MHPIRTLTVVASLSAAPLCAASPVIINPDLTGPVGIGVVPPGWSLWTGSPDTCDAGGPFNNTPTPWVLSPNGGTFVRAGGTSTVGGEGFAQVVTGFTPGALYTLTFFQTNLGFEHPTNGSWNGTDGYWDLMLDGSHAGSSAVLTKPTLNTDPIAWSIGLINFVAPAASFEMALWSRSADPSGLAAYMGIDGFDVRLVPAPSGLAAFAFAGIALSRRRR